MGKPPILIIGSNPRNLELLDQFLSREGYETIAATTIEGFAEKLDTEQSVGLALVDIVGFNPKIWEPCEQCANKGIPLLLISAPQHLSVVRQEGLAHGAKGVLGKPLAVPELMNLVKTLILES
ncbi:MAG: response regulator [Anaerolineaceae bacterium]|nr:response regulator [Anaerolineaceae bacterium]